MESYNENAPAGQSMPWYTVWTEVVTHPSRATFRRILADPAARPGRAFIWVAVLGLIFGILYALLYPFDKVNPFGAAPRLGLGVYMLCAVILAPIFAAIGLAVGAAILHGIAKLLGGVGTYNPLVYCQGAIQAPLSIISYLLSLVSLLLTRFAGNAGSLATLCIVPFTLAAGIYYVVLQVLAVDEVEKIGTGKAVLTVLIPVIIVILIAGCIAAGAILFYSRQLSQ